MCGSAATNLAAAVGKILITVVTVGFLIIIETLAVHEVDWLHSLLRELDLVSANVLAESDVMLLERNRDHSRWDSFRNDVALDMQCNAVNEQHLDFLGSPALPYNNYHA